MDTLNLRTMARKSVFNGGKHEGRSVQQLLDLQHTRYLRWVYFNLSKISFLPDILDEIGITEEWRIEKPGKDPEKGRALDEYKDKNHNNFLKRQSETDPQRAIREDAHFKATLRRESRRSSRQFFKEDARFFSKGAMQSRNHGHY